MEASLEGYHAKGQNPVMRTIHPSKFEKPSPDARNIGGAKADVEVSQQIRFRNIDKCAVFSKPVTSSSSGSSSFRDAAGQVQVEKVR